MISPESLRNIIRISLEPLGWWSQEAEELLLMTAAHESGMGKYNHQIKGPALGIYQMEPGTFYGGYDNYLNYPGRRKLKKDIGLISGVSSPELMQLQFNPVYSSIMARLKYRRAPGALPHASDTWAMAEYAKDHYNTNLGKATPEKYHDAYRRLVLN
ncbi:MAG: hypothetical protein ACI8PB_002917 [Desulforhopalus sp.]|jgi:hypothetical protein